MKGKIPMKGGDEYDALTGYRRFYKFRPGVRKSIKKKFMKRMRKFLKHLIGKEDA